MRNLPKIFWNSSTVERLKNRVGLGTKLKKELETKNPKIGMAILAYERPEYLEVSLDSLFHTNLYDFDITFFICDDGSQDTKVKQIIEKIRDKKYKIVRWYFEKGPYSAGAAINRATKEMLKYDKFDIIGWADPDVLWHPEWLKKSMDIALWAKANHKEHTLGPFTSFNSSDYIYHRILGIYDSPFGKYLVKRQAGMLNYFYFREDFEKLGYFEETLDDEKIMTEKFEKLKVRNFCTEISYIEHIGQYSVLNKLRPTKYDKAMFAINPVQDGWYIDYRKFREFEPEYYQKIDIGYKEKISELVKRRKTNLVKRVLKSFVK